ncbi:MAG TPA: 4-hydroxybutyrate dehydrogenase, partial [Clostridiaceae bacterium]|nr:4-hydroxybutyrate dehydrogenase [Clostridiaceae bacterium]
MQFFKTKLDLLIFDDLSEFIDSEELTENDLILTAEFLYKAYIEKSELPCPIMFLETYGVGEPSDKMVDAMRADLPKKLRRIIAIG